MNSIDCVVKTNIDLESRRYDVARIEKARINSRSIGLERIECSKRQTSITFRDKPTRLKAGLLKDVWKSEEGQAIKMV